VSLAIWDHTVLPATRHKWNWTHPALTPAIQAGTRFIYPGGMEGWVDIVDLIAPRPGLEPAAFRSRVQRSTTAPPRQAGATGIFRQPLPSPQSWDLLWILLHWLSFYKVSVLFRYFSVPNLYVGHFYRTLSDWCREISSCTWIQRRGRCYGLPGIQLYLMKIIQVTTYKSSSDRASHAASSAALDIKDSHYASFSALSG